jgi:hypothetical protein
VKMNKVIVNKNLTKIEKQMAQAFPPVGVK